MHKTLDNASLLRSPAELTAREFEIGVRRLAEDLTYGTDPSRFVGSGTEYAQTRLFSWGDPVRAIDWRVTARTGRAHVKDYQATKRVPMFIVLDHSASMAVRSTALSKHELGVWLAGVIALVGLMRRSPVAVVSAAGSPVDDGARASAIHPTLSRGRVWQSLHVLRLGGSDGVTRLRRAIERIEGISRVASLVVIISDLHDPEALPAIKRLGQRHDCLVAQVADPLELTRARVGFLRASEPETRRDVLVTSGTSLLSHRTAHRRSGLVERLTRGLGRAARDEHPRNFVDDIHAELLGAGVDHALLRTDQPILGPLRRLLDARSGHANKAR